MRASPLPKSPSHLLHVLPIMRRFLCHLAGASRPWHTVSVTADCSHARLPETHRTAPLPSPRGPCQGDGSLAAGAARYEVKNSTAYDLRVILDGPVVQEIRVAPNSVQAVTFPMGAYKTLGRVADRKSTRL